jgi:hypothetical protein
VSEREGGRGREKSVGVYCVLYVCTSVCVRTCARMFVGCTDVCMCRCVCGMHGRTCMCVWVCGCVCAFIHMTCVYTRDLERERVRVCVRVRVRVRVSGNAMRNWQSDCWFLTLHSHDCWYICLVLSSFVHTPLHIHLRTHCRREHPSHERGSWSGMRRS